LVPASVVPTTPNVIPNDSEGPREIQEQSQSTLLNNLSAGESTVLPTSPVIPSSVEESGESQSQLPEPQKSDIPSSPEQQPVSLPPVVPTTLNNFSVGESTPPPAPPPYQASES
ncbi:MAG: hypothetical protein AAB855_02585, partial [Patescibacteria group bacterium]